LHRGARNGRKSLDDTSVHMGSYFSLVGAELLINLKIRTQVTPGRKVGYRGQVDDYSGLPTYGRKGPVELHAVLLVNGDVLRCSREILQVMPWLDPVRVREIQRHVAPPSIRELLGRQLMSTTDRCQYRFLGRQIRNPRAAKH